MNHRFIPQIIDPNSKLEAAAREFNYNNPEVFFILERRVRELMNEVVGLVGMGPVFEDFRWKTPHTTLEHLKNPDTGEPFKLNNNHRSYYTRWFVQRNPQWEKRIRTRRLGSRQVLPRSWDEDWYEVA